MTIGFAGCSDDGNGFDKEAFCKIAQQFADADGPPTPDQVKEYVDAAPPEVEDEANTVEDLLDSVDGDFGKLFSDPEKGEQFETAIGPLEEQETELCGIEHSDEDDGPPAGDPEPAEGAAVVEIAAVDFAFENVPDEVDAGLTAFAFSNVGESAHEMFIGKLAEGTTMDDVLAFEGDPSEGGLVTEEVGGTFGEPGAEVSYINGELTPGTYGLVCFIPGPDGKSHAELGMVDEFTVV